MYFRIAFIPSKMPNLGLAAGKARNNFAKSAIDMKETTGA
jgi:hypothetical protein